MTDDDTPRVVELTPADIKALANPDEAADQLHQRRLARQRQELASIGRWTPETLNPVSRLDVPPEELAAAREAAALAASAQRLIDLQHLRGCVTHTDQGPAVLWHDIERVMPTA